MEKILLLVVAMMFTLTSCTVKPAEDKGMLSKTNEEKARELIESEVKASLIRPESYEFAQMQLDSCFSDSQQNPEVLVFVMRVAELYEKYKDCASEAERAESSMTIYAPSYGNQSAHDKQQQKKYKAEMEKARRKAADTKVQILQLLRDNKKLIMDYFSGNHEFIGWMIIFSYRAETAGGLKTIGEKLFFLNKDLTKITNRFSEDDIRYMQSNIDDFKYEFEEELKEIFEVEE